jgi:hypothetical protein
LQVKFTGQVKIPELDSPGVPAVILIEDPQAELLVEGESLGRWSLVDVRAERLVANAFSLDLDGDEVTFIADDPIDFAYGGVEQMANIWARYKTMTLPRRVVATSRSRRGIKPSRVGDLRTAIEETISSPAPSAPLPGLETRAPRPQPVPEPVVEPVAKVEPVVEPVAKVEPVVEPVAKVEPVVEPVAKVEPEQVPEVESEEVINPRLEREPPRVISMGPTTKDSIFKDGVPWAKKRQEEPPVPVEPTPPPRPLEPTPPPRPLEPTPSPRPVVKPAIESAEEPRPKEPVQEPRRPKEPVQEPRLTPEEPVPWLDPSASPTPEGPRHLEPAAASSAEPSTGSGSADGFVVDLGAFEERDRSPVSGDRSDGNLPGRSKPEPVPSRDEAPTDDRVLEPAMSTATEKGGLMGAVRSAFVRNRDVHDHHYVTAPGGMGIVRHICEDCGHISIGVSE